MDDESTLQFYEYLAEEEKETTSLLQPYFLRLQSREDSYQNTYGVATPGDLTLLRKLQTIRTIKSNLHVCGSFDQLKSSLLEKLDNNEDNNDTSVINAQLQLINGWAAQKETESIKKH